MPDQIISQFQRIYNLPIETNRATATAATRDAIPSGVRWEGLIVFVINENQTYILNNGITNSDWQVFGHSAGVTDTFTSNDGKTITVTNGIITNIV